MVLVFVVTTLLYMITTITKLTLNNKFDDNGKYIIAEIESVTSRLPIEEDELKFLSSFPEVNQFKEIKVINIFVEELGVFEFVVEDVETITFSEALFELVKEQNDIELFSGEQKAIIALSEIKKNTHHNSINESALKKLFNTELAELATITVRVHLEHDVNLDTFESKLLKRGLKFRDYNDNKFKMLTIGGFEIIEYLFGGITILNYIITGLISFSLCKENKRNMAILRIHGYGKNEVRFFLLLQYGKIFVISNLLVLGAYFLIMVMIELLGDYNINLGDERMFALYGKTMCMELLVGIVVTLVVCEKYLRTNVLKTIKQ